MNQKIIKNLVKYGLSEVEAKVYCAGLALDDANVDKIAKYADINRTSCYPILERLQKMGLIGQAKKRGKATYKSVAPEKFYELLDSKKDSLEEVLPDLKSLFEISRGRPDVRFFEGEEGLKTVFNTILNEAKELYVFGEGGSFIKTVPGWTENYVEKRAKKNIRVKMILKASPDAVKAIKRIKKTEIISKTIKVRMLPEAYKIDCSSFDVYNKKVVLYSFKKPYNAIVVENGLINQLLRTVFNILWDTAEKYDHLMK